MKVEIYKCKLCGGYVVAVHGHTIMECCGFTYKLKLLKSSDVTLEEFKKQTEKIFKEQP